MSRTFKNTDDALPVLAAVAIREGREVGSRLGERTMELLHEQIVLQQPWQREVLTMRRNANVVAQIAETMWVLAGRNDVEWLGHYLPRAKDFSDDGEVWRGGYGPRLRAWGGYPHQNGEGRVGHDQVRHVVDLLSQDRSSRRAVMAIYDPRVDSAPGKDIPCNDFLSFISRDGYLHLSVFVRSNDLIWGWSGINAFEWSALQEIIAGILGIRVGNLIFNTTSLHVYDRHWRKAQEFAVNPLAVELQDSPRFLGGILPDILSRTQHPIDRLDELISRWFDMEAQIREGGFLPGEAEQLIEGFPEPMFRSWLRVIAWYWSGKEEYLKPLEGTRLWAAVQEIPQSIQSQVAARAPRMAYVTIGRPSGPDGRYEPGDTVDVYPIRDTRGVVEPLKHKPAFIEYVDNLHREKSAAYGDSWKKRGEQMSILANIARKVDRLEGGKSTEDEVIADTAIDLLVYLIKYRLWLSEQYSGLPRYADTPVAIEENDALLEVLHRLDRTTTLSPTPQNISSYTTSLVRTFEMLALRVETDPHGRQPGDRAIHVSQLIQWAFMVARYLWEKENTPDFQNPYRNIADEDEQGWPY